MMKSMNDPNKLYWDFDGSFIKSMFSEDKKILRNIWDRMGVPPIAPFGEFFNPISKDCIWRKY